MVLSYVFQVISEGFYTPQVMSTRISPINSIITSTHSSHRYHSWDMVIYTDPLYSPFPNWSSCCRSTIYEFDGVSWYQSSGQKSTAFGQQNLCPKLLFTVHRRFFSGRCRIPDVGKELVTTHWVFHTKHSNILKAGDFCFDM